LAGIVIGGGLVWIIRIFASAAMKREAMGFGDVTLLAMIGAFLGWQATIIIFFLAPLVGVVFAIGRLVLRREDEIPFGPFLCVAASVCALAWPPIWDFTGDHYFSLGWKLLLVLLACVAVLLLLLPPVRWIADRFRASEEDDDARGAEQDNRKAERYERGRKSNSGGATKPRKK
jgi:uncharacterized membrane protein